jgi:hypothetical protein
MSSWEAQLDAAIREILVKVSGTILRACHY